MRYKIFKNCEENVRWKERKTERERENQEKLFHSAFKYSFLEINFNLLTD